jgi:hypothetical protein
MSVSGQGDEMVVGMAIDKSDNITMTGYVYGNSYLNNSVLLQSKDSVDVFVSRCDKHGNVLWTNVFGGKDINSPNAITVDHEGNTYVSGYFRNDFYVDGQLFSGKGKYRYFFTKLDNIGKVAWVKTFKAPDESYVWQHSLYCDKDDNIYLTLQFEDTIVAEGVAYITKHTRGDILIKYNPEGILQWAKVMENLGNANGSILGLSDDGTGHLFMCGALRGTPARWGGKDIEGLGPIGWNLPSYVYFSRLDKQSGDMQWIKIGMSKPGSAALEIIKPDISGNFYVAGYFMDTLTIDSLKIAEYNGTFPIPVVLRVDASGKVVWSKMMAGLVKGLCVDSKGYLYTAGIYAQAIEQDKLILRSLGEDIYVFRFDSTGKITSGRSTTAENTNSQVNLMDFTANSEDRLYACGWTYGGTTFGDTSLNSKYSEGYVWALPSNFSFASIDEFSPEQNITVYPNPLSGNDVTIRLPEKLKEEAKINCFDAVGRIVYSTTFTGNAENGYHLQLPSLTTGVYLLKISTGNHNYVSRLLKSN